MRSDLTAEYVRRRLTYDRSTGVFRWRERSPDTFRDGPKTAAHEAAIWNAKHAGKVAGRERPDGYREIRIDGIGYLAHRLAWLYETGEWPEDEIDHRNRSPSINEFENLRPASSAQNKQNSAPRRKSRSGVKGIDRAHGKWRARIGFRGQSIHLGLFDDLEEASAAYADAALKLFGSFACPSRREKDDGRTVRE